MAVLRNVLPGIDEVLGHTDAGWWTCDRDLAHGWAISGAGNFDVSSRDLANLIDLATLSSNYAANELGVGDQKHANNKTGMQKLDFTKEPGSNRRGRFL